MALQLEDFLPYYPDINDPRLQRDIYAKKEFYDYKLTREQEPLVDRRLKQQVIIERLFSEFTPYDEGLLYMSLGGGKTCAAFALSESLKQRKSFRQCVVLARGDDSLDNLRRELVINCSLDYKLEVDETQQRTMTAEMRKIRHIVKDFYVFKTYYTFAKQLAAQSDELLAKTYDKTLFIVDEGHNIHAGSQEEAKMVYAQLFRLFHVDMRRKILILTGTPMRDDVSELADIMNLLLPLEKQLPTGANFTAEFLRREKDGTYSVREDNVGILKEYLRGRISYMSEAAINIPVVYEGKSAPPDIPQFRSVDLIASDHQSKAYALAYEADTSGEKRSIYTNSSQASLFVFPDGSWGAEGAATYIKKRGELKPEFAAQIQTSLADYSVKYAEVVEILRAQSTKRKNVYIYCSLVNGSGAKLLAKILELNGYMPCQGTEVGRAQRYMLLTSDTKNITRLISYFNRAQNRFGEYCQVIVGSRKIAEAFSFKNVQVELVLTLHWNEAETLQAIRRGMRFQSWNALLEDNVAAAVSVAKLCTVPNVDADTSVDKLMLEFSRRKDISIKRVDRVIKEISFDCPLMYERNVNSAAGDFSRECDYDVCAYTCDGGNVSAMNGGVDIATYELYYENFYNLVDPIISLFSQRDNLSYNALVEMIRPTENIQMLKALAHIIENNVPITNRYRAVCYLRESSDIYYLTQDIATLDTFSLSRPLFTRRASLDTAIRTTQLMHAIDVLKGNQDVSSRRLETEQMAPDAVDLLVKLAVKEKIRGNEGVRVAAILEHFKDVIYLAAPNSAHVAVFRAHDDTTWCLGAAGKWTACEEQIPRAEVEAAYEGIVGEDNKFCIRKMKQKVGVSKDKRKMATGAVCVDAGYKKQQLLDIIEEMKIPNSDDQVPWPKKTKKVICGLIQAWFKTQGLLRKGKCGTSRRRRN